MYQINISRDVIIQDCPENGLAAVDFRRAAGLPEDTSNEIRLDVSAQDEAVIRAIAAVCPCAIDASGDFTSWHSLALPDTRYTYQAQAWAKVLDDAMPRVGVAMRAFSAAGSAVVTTEAPFVLPAAIIAGVLRKPLTPSAMLAFVAAWCHEFARCLTIVQGWRATFLEQQAKEAAEKQAAELALATARELLAEELAAGAKAKADLETVSNFLSEIPQDALRGTLRRLTAGHDQAAVTAMQRKVEEASPYQVFQED